MTRIAITGIGGFIGLRMCQRALDLGWQVTGVDHNAEAAKAAVNLGATVTIGDINDKAALKDAFSGADMVFHTAAIVAEDGDRAAYETVNVQGTRSVCEVAKACGVKRLVHLSSVMVYGFNFPQDVTEAGPLDGQGNVYNDTKLASDILARQFNCDTFSVVVVRPGDVYGVGSQPWIERPLSLLRQRLFALPDRGTGVINAVHVDNLIDGVMLAFESEKAAGLAFNITDGVATPCQEFFSYHAKSSGRRLLHLPAALLEPSLGALEFVCKRLGRPVPLSREGIYFLQRKHRYSIHRARSILGYIPRIPLEKGLPEVMAHYQRA